MAREIALLDWDGTLRPGIMLLDWSAFLAGAGILPMASMETMRAMAARYRAGETPYDDFVTMVVDEYARGMAAAEAEVVDRAASDFVKLDQAALFPLATHLLTCLKRLDLDVTVISGSPMEPLSVYAGRLGLAHLVATELEVTDGRYSGRVIRNVAQGATKEAAVQEIASQGIAFAAGDRPVDAAMVGLARVGAFVAARGVSAPVGFREDALRLTPDASAEEVERALRGLARGTPA